MADVTSDFIDKLIANGKSAQGKAGLDNAGQRAGSALGPVGGLIGRAIGTGVRWEWFYQQVRNGGPWDFKNNDYKPYKASGLVICGVRYGNDMPGNFHFGFVGSAAGFMSVTLQKGAGKAQERAGTSRPEFHCTFGDDPQDNEYIRLGIKLYQQHKLGVTAKNLGAILSQFSPKVCAAP